MLVIREAQMAVLRTAARERFERRMVAHLATAFPVQCGALALPAAPRAWLPGAVRDGIKRAATYGITTEVEVQRFLELSLRLGPAFERVPAWRWVVAILQEPGPAAAAKLELIDQLMPLRADPESHAVLVTPGAHAAPSAASAEAAPAVRG